MTQRFAHSRKDVRDAEKASRLAARERHDTVRTLMSSPSGRTYIWDKLAESHIYSTTFVPGDALASAFNEGQRSTGLALLADILLACPDLYILAQQEANVRHTLDNNRHTTDQQRRAEEPDGGDSGREGSEASPDNYGDFDSDRDRTDDLYGEAASRTDH